MKTQRSLRRLLATAAASLALAHTAPALAHAEHGQAKYGGLVAEAGLFQGELVAKGSALTLYITNHGEPVPTSGASAKMTVLSAGQKSEVVFAPAGDNRLAAPSGAALPAGAKAVVSVKLGDGRSGALRFERP